MALDDRTALIIEDDDDIRRLLEILLQKGGYSVTTATTGAEGLEALQRVHPTLVTVDVGLPDMDGHRVVRTVRESFAGVIVMISARSSSEDRRAGLAAGADMYFTKPFRPRELRAALAEIVDSHFDNGVLSNGLNGRES